MTTENENETAKHQINVNDRWEKYRLFIAEVTALGDSLEPATNLDSPEFAQRIDWTTKERAAILAGAKLMRERFTRDYSKLMPSEKNSFMMTALKVAMKKLLPERRHREITGTKDIPAADLDVYLKTFDVIPRKAGGADEKPDATNGVPEVPPAPKKITWTPQEQRAVLIHTCHNLRKQGVRIIPNIQDPTGNIQLSDAIALGQEKALPRHRRILGSGRAIFLDHDMFPRFEPMLKLPILPDAPAKPPEIDEVVNSPRPSDEKLTNATSMFHPAPPTPPAPAPEAPQEPVTPFQTAASKKLAEFDDEELLREAVGRIFNAFGRLKKLEKEVEESKAYADAIAEENSRIAEKVAKQGEQIASLEERVKELSVNPGHVKLPRVAIVGCRKDLFDEIVKRAPEHGLSLDFRHYEQEQSKVVPIFADWAIVMPGLSHAQHDHVTRVIPQGQWVFQRQFSTTATLAQLVAWFKADESLAR